VYREIHTCVRPSVSLPTAFSPLLAHHRFRWGAKLEKRRVQEKNRGKKREGRRGRKIGKEREKGPKRVREWKNAQRVFPYDVRYIERLRGSWSACFAYVSFRRLRVFSFVRTSCRFTSSCHPSLSFSLSPSPSYLSLPYSSLFVTLSLYLPSRVLRRFCCLHRSCHRRRCASGETWCAASGRQHRRRHRQKRAADRQRRRTEFRSSPIRPIRAPVLIRGRKPHDAGARRIAHYAVKSRRAKGPAYRRCRTKLLLVFLRRLYVGSTDQREKQRRQKQHDHHLSSRDSHRASSVSRSRRPRRRRRRRRHRHRHRHRHRYRHRHRHRHRHRRRRRRRRRRCCRRCRSTWASRCRALGRGARASSPRCDRRDYSVAKRGGGGREAEEESRESATTVRPTVVRGVCCYESSGRLRARWRHRRLRERVRDERERTRNSTRMCAADTCASVWPSFLSLVCIADDLSLPCTASRSLRWRSFRIGTR